VSIAEGVAWKRIVTWHERARYLPVSTISEFWPEWKMFWDGVQLPTVWTAVPEALYWAKFAPVDVARRHVKSIMSVRMG